MRHGGFYPDRKLRLFKRGSARLSEGVGPHSTPQFEGPRGKLRHDMLHYAYPDMNIYLEHMNRYSSEIAQLLVNTGRTSKSLPALIWNAVLNPAATFIYNYFFRLGFLDGREGLLLHLNHSVYIHWKFIKAWWMGRGKVDQAGLESAVHCLGRAFVLSHPCDRKNREGWGTGHPAQISVPHPSRFFLREGWETTNVRSAPAYADPPLSFGGISAFADCDPGPGPPQPERPPAPPQRGMVADGQRA